MNDNKVALTAFFNQWEVFSLCEVGSWESKWGEAREPIPHENVNCVIKHKLFNGVIMGCLNGLYYMNLEAECKFACVPITEESKDYLSFWGVFQNLFSIFIFWLLPISRLLCRNNNQLGKPRRRLT